MNPTTYTPKKIKSLYSIDYHQWIEETVKHLQEKNFEVIDWQNLIDEVIDLGKSERNAVKSLLTRLLEHIFKLSYWESEKAYNAAKWRSEIVAFRNQIKDHLEDSPSLKPYLENTYPKCFKSARESMSELFPLPDDLQIPLENVLDSHWFPDEK
jgi:hypothetical protein